VELLSFFSHVYVVGQSVYLWKGQKISLSTLSLSSLSTFDALGLKLRLISPYEKLFSLEDFIPSDSYSSNFWLSFHVTKGVDIFMASVRKAQSLTGLDDSELIFIPLAY
jgi:hypothetical protein